AMIFAPFCASATAAARPMPALAPVTSTALPANGALMRSPLCRCLMDYTQRRHGAKHGWRVCRNLASHIRSAPAEDRRRQRARIALRPLADIDGVKEIGEMPIEGFRLLEVDEMAGVRHHDQRGG